MVLHLSLHRPVLLLAWGTLVGCSPAQDEVFSTLKVGFAQPTSSSDEAVGLHAISLVLSGPSQRPVKVDYEIFADSAADHHRCLGMDFSGASGTLVFEPGQVRSTLSLSIIQDTVAEADETLSVRITSVTGAVENSVTNHEVTIVDDDRTAVVAVSDYEARPNDEEDDTEALQDAFDEAASRSGSVVVFEPGTYQFTQLNLAPGVTYSGYGTTLEVAPSAAPNEPRLVAQFGSNTDTDPMILQGLVIDGRRENFADFLTSAQDKSSLIRMRGDPTLAGRLLTIVEDVTVRNGGGDGFEILENIEGHYCDIAGEDIWRDFIALRGGHTEVSFRGIVASGDIGSTGMWLGPRDPGYAGSTVSDITIEDAQLLDGDLEIALGPGARLTAERLHMSKGPLRLGGDGATISFEDSTITTGPPDERFNLITSPGDMTFRACTFRYTEEALSEGPTTRVEPASVIHVDWRAHGAEGTVDPSMVPERRHGQQLRFEGCTFESAEDLGSDLDLSAVSASGGGMENQLTITDATLGRRVTQTWGEPCRGCIR